MTMLIRAASLIDGSGTAPIADPTLVVEGGRIAAVHKGLPPAGAVPPMCEVLDFPGCTIMPGMIDTHVHLNLPGDGTVLEEAMREEDGVLVATSAYTAGRALAAGITTVRDLGGARTTVIALRRALQLGHGIGPRIVCCGQPITITGGHTWYFGGEADGVEGVRAKVRHMAKLGADFIKVMGSGGGTLNTISWRPSFRREELAAMADEAHRLERKIAVHCLCAESIDYAVEAGVDQIEHAGFIINSNGDQKLDMAVVDRLARSGIPVTGTLAVGGAVIETLEARERRTPAEEAMLTRWRRMLDANLHQLGKLREAGVALVAGTDAGWRFTPFDGLPMELSLMHRAGMPRLEAITAATGFAASVIGIGSETGTLKPGLAADVIVVGRNPADDLAALKDLRLVMRAGTIVRGGQGLGTARLAA
jgi:imidazolonepropionase-like amidohydrolase